VFRIDHAAGEHDDRAIALALAATHALDRTPSPSRWNLEPEIRSPAVTAGLLERIF
jgi:hypothetical protein